MYKTVQSSGKKELRKRFTVGSCQMSRKKRAKDASARRKSFWRPWACRTQIITVKNLIQQPTVLAVPFFHAVSPANGRPNRPSVPRAPAISPAPQVAAATSLSPAHHSTDRAERPTGRVDVGARGRPIRKRAASASGSSLRQTNVAFSGGRCLRVRDDNCVFL
jgi:hypothetical protein